MASQANHRPSSCREFVEDLTGHTTRRVPTTDGNASLAELWYLVYQDETGEKHTVKGTTPAIRRSLKEGLLGDAADVLASRRKLGPFEELQAHPEFRDLVLELTEAPAEPVAPSASSSRKTKSTHREETLPPREAQQLTSKAGEATAAPHIALDKTPFAWKRWRGWEWLTWLGLLAIAVLSALAAFYFIPDRLFRWWFRW
jgi:hypothetical protein